MLGALATALLNLGLGVIPAVGGSLDSLNTMSTNSYSDGM
jgi:hypothetical protein